MKNLFENVNKDMDCDLVNMTKTHHHNFESVIWDTCLLHNIVKPINKETSNTVGCDDHKNSNRREL